MGQVYCWSCSVKNDESNKRCVLCGVTLKCDRQCGEYQEAWCPGTAGVCTVLKPVELETKDDT